VIAGCRGASEKAAGKSREDKERGRRGNIRERAREESCIYVCMCIFCKLQEAKQDEEEARMGLLQVPHVLVFCIHT
jgi:hypothetical protein